MTEDYMIDNCPKCGTKKGVDDIYCYECDKHAGPEEEEQPDKFKRLRDLQHYWGKNIKAIVSHEQKVSRLEAELKEAKKEMDRVKYEYQAELEDKEKAITVQLEILFPRYGRTGER